MGCKKSVRWLAVWWLAAMVLASCSSSSISPGASSGASTASQFASGLKAFHAKDYATAQKLWQAAAQAGDAEAENGRRHLPAGGTANAIAIDEEIAGRVGRIGKLDVRHALACL